MSDSGLNCTDVRPLVDAYLDQELDAFHSSRVDSHLRECAVCQHQYRTQAVLHAAFKGAAYFSAPPDLAAQLRTQLPRMQQPALRPRLPLWMRFGPAFAAVFFAAWVGVLYLHPATTGEQLAQELLSSHVRSLMASHLTDVASSDHHTVKPWFNGKLDFSPPVADLAEQGFPLVGGRLDYVGHRAVAALIYQRRKHFINLFVWPDQTGKDMEPRTTLLQGYQLVRWHRAGMNYWAVSDLNPVELEMFVAQVRSSINRP